MRKVFACGCHWDNNIFYDDLFYKYKRMFLGVGKDGKAINKTLNKMNKIKIGDLIAIKKRQEIIALGEVNSAIEKFKQWKDYVGENESNKYRFSLEAEIHTVGVKEWIKLDIPINYPIMGSHFIHDEYKKLCNEAYKKGIYKMKQEEIINILKNKKQIILQGAPGTGKTYLSPYLAVKLIDENAPSDRAELMKRYKELVDKEQIFFTTFHQSMDYEEFVEGIKPKTENGNITYELEDGIFKKACKTAESKSNKVVLIIDEINRGNISKIFGELITLLETDKRKGKENEIEAILPYSKEKFSVPDNLYIIGTMNTADRSIGYVDYALRRRFAFITIRAEEDKIKNYYDNKDYDCGEKAKILFGKIAKLIKENINEEFDADDIMVGHSYFMAQNLEELQNKLEYEIKPLLLEYLKDGILKLNDETKDKVNKLNINNLEL